MNTITMPTYLLAGDYVRCFKCDIRLFRVERNISNGMILLPRDFKAVPGIPQIRNGDPMLCSKCGTPFYEHGSFREIERNAESYYQTGPGKNGLESD